MKRDEYFAKNKDKIVENVISEESEDSYKSPQVLIDQLFRLFFSGNGEAKHKTTKKKLILS